VSRVSCGLMDFAKSSLFVSNKLDGNVDVPKPLHKFAPSVRPSGGVLSVIGILRQKAGCSPAEAKMSPDGPLFL
jgi:hypothetical protein